MCFKSYRYSNWKCLNELGFNFKEMSFQRSSQRWDRLSHSEVSRAPPAVAGRAKVRAQFRGRRTKIGFEVGPVWFRSQRVSRDGLSRFRVTVRPWRQGSFWLINVTSELWSLVALVVISIEIVVSMLMSYGTCPKLSVINSWVLFYSHNGLILGIINFFLIFFINQFYMAI